MTDKWRRTSNAISQNEEQTQAMVDGYPHVFSEHNDREVSCRDHYFSAPQQVYIIPAALDDVYEDDVNQSEARQLLIVSVHLSPQLIESLIKEKRWPRRFSLLWESLNDTLKTELIAEDWVWYDSYWPGFEFYNHALCSIMTLPSGKPADMFSAGYYSPPKLADEALEVLSGSDA